MGEPPRKIALQPCHHGQQGFAVDTLDQLTMPRGVSQQRLPAILASIVTNEACGHSPSAQGDGYASGGSPGCRGDLFYGESFSHDIQLYAVPCFDATI